MGDVLSRFEALTNESGENGTYHRRDSENKKIDRAGSTSFYLIRIGLLDGGVRNQ